MVWSLGTLDMYRYSAVGTAFVQCWYLEMILRELSFSMHKHAANTHISLDALGMTPSLSDARWGTGGKC